jgi:hypothetical protein
VITDEYLESVRERLSAARSGPWASHIEGRDFLGGDSLITTGGEDIYLSGASAADQDFIAHAKEDVEILLTEVLRLRKLILDK